MFLNLKLKKAGVLRCHISYFKAHDCEIEEHLWFVRSVFGTYWHDKYIFIRSGVNFYSIYKTLYCDLSLFLKKVLAHTLSCSLKVHFTIM